MSMNIGTHIFQKEIPFVVELEGNLNGVEFSVRGKGMGDARTGTTKGSYVCTTGELPVSWCAITQAFQYGVVCFTKYPKDIPDYIKSLFPEGYHKVKTIEFLNDGSYIEKHKVTLENGVIYNRVTIQGDNFNENGKIFQKTLNDKEATGFSYYYPGKDGLRSQLVKLIEDKEGGWQEVRIDQTITPVSDGPTAAMTQHYYQYNVEYSKDPTEKRDNIIMMETAKAFTA